MSTSTILFALPLDFFSKIMESSQAIALEWLQVILRSTWSMMSPSWPYIFGGFFVILVIAMLKLMVGETGLLGSLIYHVIYFGILGLILWIGGLEILFNPFFDLIYALLYPISFYLTGRILGYLG